MNELGALTFSILAKGPFSCSEGPCSTTEEHPAAHSISATLSKISNEAPSLRGSCVSDTVKREWIQTFLRLFPPANGDMQGRSQTASAQAMSPPVTSYRDSGTAKFQAPQQWLPNCTSTVHRWVQKAPQLQIPPSDSNCSHLPNNSVSTSCSELLPST